MTSKTTKRPNAKRRPTTRGPHADVLAVIEDVRLPHRRRAAMCRFALRKGLHRREAVAVLRAIATRPDRSMTPKDRDLALRTLADRAPRAPMPRVLPDNWIGRNIADIGLYKGAKLIPVEEWDALSDLEKFPITQLGAELSVVGTEDGGDDD